MKKLMVIALLLISATVQAQVQVNLMKMVRLSNDDAFYTGDWTGIELSYQFKDSPWYVYGGYEKTGVYAGGRIWDYTFKGLGVGMRHNVSDHINIFGQVGYYFVSNSWGGRRNEFNEAGHYYLNSLWQESLPGPYDSGTYYVFDEFEVRNSDTIGISVGLEVDYPISKNWNAGFLVAYRYMNIEEYIAGYRDEWAGIGWWELGRSHDYSSLNLGVTIDYRF